MIKEKLAKLINVKTFVTIMLTVVFCYLSFIGVIAAEIFLTVYATVIAFYFGTQTEKKKNTTE